MALKTAYLHRLVITVDAAVQDQANDAAVSVVGEEAGRHTFTVPLSTDGKTVTHYVCNWALTWAQRDLLEDELHSLIVAGQVRVYDASEYDAQGNAKAPEWTADATLQAEGLRSLDGERVT